MAAMLVNIFERLLSLSWLTGPIFDKELRVSSRRRRNYVLRSAYLLSLTLLLGMFWIELSQRGSSTIYLASQMAEMGKRAVVNTVWFQFCATQVVAVIMLSASVSDEIYNRTLGLLMITPVTSFQIVMGKLLSKVLQLALLLAISLPLLAVIRVFGGVPWDYVISSLCITLTAMIFVGSLSLLVSIFTRRSYVATVITFLIIGFLFALLPLGVYAVWDVAGGGSSAEEKSLMAVLFLPNPYCTMFVNTVLMSDPRASAVFPPCLWFLHCAVMLVASAAVLFLAVVNARRVGLRQATGQLGSSARRVQSEKIADRVPAGWQDSAGKFRFLTWPAAQWKETRLPWLGRQKRLTSVALGAILAVVLLSYYLCHKMRILDDTEIHVVYTTIYLVLGILCTIAVSATCITAEKEARSWPVLLTTTLDEKEILRGKFAGIVRRCFPAWLLLLGHVVGFSVLGGIHPIAIVQTANLIIWLGVLLGCSGMYFSSRSRRSTTAVVMNFAFAVAIWAVVPLLLAVITGVLHVPEVAKVYIDTNPLVLLKVIMEATVGTQRLGSYYWPVSGSTGFVASAAWILICLGVYGLLSSLFAWRAKCGLRRNVF